MDVERVLAGVAEPATTARLRSWIESVESRLADDQRAALERWFNSAPFEAGAMQAFRSSRFDTAYLAALARVLERREIDNRFGMRAAPIARVFEVARDRPTLASTIVWHAIGASEPTLASTLIQAIRERARLPGLRKRITAEDLPVKPDLTWFEDHQIEDAARWAEHIPAPRASSLANVIHRVEEQRRANASNVAELAPFIQRVASFLLTLSTNALDPLGLELSRDARLVGDPPLEKRFEIAAWSRTVGRALCLRGQMMILSIAVGAPWPLDLEVIVSELGRGISGAFGIVMRLRGEVALPSTLQPAPVLLCLPGEPIEVLGARFERWSQRAYPHAVDAWRGVV